MFEGPIMAAYELEMTEERTVTDTVATGPIAGIAVALPFSLALWAVVLGVARIWF
jgi:hypothetical protein